jgi:hypothetical protein
VEDTFGPLTIPAVYLPPKHKVKQELENFNTLGRRFIAGGEYNAKHTDWGSRLISPRGRVVHKTIERNLSTGKPTYWPSGRNKVPGLIDFCITKGIQEDSAVAQSCYELSTNQSPVLITLTTHALNREKPPSISNKHTNWDHFRLLASERLTLKVPLKTEEDIEAAVKFFNETIQWAGWNAAPEYTATPKANNCPILLKQKI